LFNLEQFDIKLDTDIIGRNFIYCEEIESTNNFLLNSKEYNTEGTVLFAEYQTKGKGRKDRTWISNNAQNLTFSILLKESFIYSKPNVLNLASSMAVASSIENLFQLKTNLKWPNDVLVNEKKISGILLESVSTGKKMEKIVLGIGINVNQPSFQGKFNFTPTSIKQEYRKEVEREYLLSEVLNNLEELLFTAKDNPEKIINDWKNKSRFLGEKVKVQDGDNLKYGLFEEVDENGFMLLRTATALETIYCGDVSQL